VPTYHDTPGVRSERTTGTGGDHLDGVPRAQALDFTLLLPDATTDLESSLGVVQEQGTKLSLGRARHGAKIRSRPETDSRRHQRALLLAQTLKLCIVFFKPRRILLVLLLRQVGEVHPSTTKSTSWQRLEAESPEHSMRSGQLQPAPHRLPRTSSGTVAHVTR
jgi:hypothetical protein